MENQYVPKTFQRHIGAFKYDVVILLHWLLIYETKLGNNQDDLGCQPNIIFNETPT